MKKGGSNDQHGDFFETSLKTHYPKVYQDMIKNDYMLTHKDRTQSHLDDQYDFEAHKHANIQLEKQLADMLSGRQAPIPLSNPMRFSLKNILQDSKGLEHFQRKETTVI